MVSIGGKGTICPVKSARLTWFLAHDQGSLAGLCMQDYKSLCAAVTICPLRLTSRQTHRHTQTAFWPVCKKSSASWPNRTSWIINNGHCKLQRLRTNCIVFPSYAGLTGMCECTVSAAWLHLGYQSPRDCNSCKSSTLCFSVISIHAATVFNNN